MTAPSSTAQAPRLPDGPPLVAILRGLEPSRAVEVGTLLHEAGFRIIEVPLNRPGAIESIERLCRLDLPGTLIGAGTVLDASQVDAVHDAGGRLVVMPRGDGAVITHACARGMVVAPGVFTATEAFAALKLGAHALKLFPAEVLGPAGLAALRTVLPAGVHLWPVGGVTPESMGAWVRAGATGFGIGGALFQPGVAVDELVLRARRFVTAWQAVASA